MGVTTGSLQTLPGLLTIPVVRSISPARSGPGHTGPAASSSLALPANTNTSIFAPTGEITQMKGEPLVFSIGYSVGTESVLNVSFIFLWLQYGLHQINSMQLILMLHQALNLTEMCEALPSFWHCFFSKLIQSFHLILTLNSQAAAEAMSSPPLDLVYQTLSNFTQLSIRVIRFWEQLFDPAGLTCPNTSPTPGLNTPRIIILNNVETRMWSILMGFRNTWSFILHSVILFFNKAQLVAL